MIANLPNSSKLPAKAHSPWVSKTLAVAIVFCLGSFSHAGIMVGDWKTAGDKLITIDTTQGLEFLDLTQSKRRAYLDVILEFGVGGDFEGFRYATEQEVVNLINEIGWSGTPAFKAGSSSETRVRGEALDIIKLIGTTSASRGSSSASGLTSTFVSAGRVRTVAVSRSRSGTEKANATGKLNDFAGYSSVGSFLVRNSASSSAAGGVVPEPSSFAIFGIATVGLLGARRRKS